jgi:hypothetical protein
MGVPIDQATAEGAVARAEVFVRTVKREFGLEGMATHVDINPDASKNMDEEKQSSSIRDHAAETSATSQPWSLEETHRSQSHCQAPPSFAGCDAFHAAESSSA